MIVIADDITGAAEIAGMAHSRGQQVRLLTSFSASGDSVAAKGTVVAATDTPLLTSFSASGDSVAAKGTVVAATDAPLLTSFSASGDSVAAKGTVVIATDTRSMTEAEAVAETRRIASQFLNFPFSHSLNFKKTDSALRGHVVAELTTLMEAMGYKRAVYLPANPSKGRIIKNGVYYIGNKPIHETAFSYDPEFPATTSVLRERFPDAEAHHILMPDAESLEDIRRVVAAYNDGHTLFAGAADLLEALVGDDCQPSRHDALPSNRSVLILCGSTQSKPLDLKIPVAPMPLEIYDGADDLSLWNTDAYTDCHSMILTIPHRHRTGHAAAVHLRTVMARMAAKLVSQHRPDELIIEGGATAWATLKALGWTDFTITQEIAPGVVRMQAKNCAYVTLKPGSYPWNGLFEGRYKLI